MSVWCVGTKRFYVFRLPAARWCACLEVAAGGEEEVLGLEVAVGHAYEVWLFKVGGWGWC